MCYSAQIRSDYRKYQRMFDATLSIQDYVELFYWRTQDSSIKVPKGMEVGFEEPRTDEERRVRELIDQYVRDQTVKVEQELFVQRKRLADAERVLDAKPTKAAAESKRIATDKISRALTRLADLKRTEPKDRDSRIFPGMYAPVLVMENGKRVIKPMRYQCRPAGKPAFYDRKFPGTYNAMGALLTVRTA